MLHPVDKWMHFSVVSVLPLNRASIAPTYNTSGDPCKAFAIFYFCISNVCSTAISVASVIFALTIPCAKCYGRVDFKACFVLTQPVILDLKRSMFQHFWWVESLSPFSNWNMFCSSPSRHCAVIARSCQIWFTLLRQTHSSHKRFQFKRRLDFHKSYIISERAEVKIVVIRNYFLRFSFLRGLFISLPC